jgi:glycosyltransferase involved in cell wall biosynthesis
MGASMAELSVIIPFVNEYPQIVFTVRSIMEELRDRVDYEIILVDNFCKEVQHQGKENDKGGEAIEAVLPGQPNIKLLKKGDKLSHWNAKNMAVEASTGKFLWFTDAHTIPARDSLFEMFQFYSIAHRRLNGTIHMPLTYKILEYRKLIYKLMADTSIGKVDYSFDNFRESKEPYTVPCMSSCGMMITRDLYDLVGGFPKTLGSYSGGEHFINFTLAVLGKNVWIWPGEPLYHHGDKRGYSMNGTDIMTNRGIATYLFGGSDLLMRYLSNVRYIKNDVVRERTFMKITSQNEEQRELIKSLQKICIDEWIERWKEVKCERE